MAALEDAGRPCTRSQLARAFAAGDVTCEGEVVRPGRCVEHPSTVEVRLPDSPLLVALPEAIPLTILHEDPELLVVDKPAGMVVHAGPGHDQGTLVGAVLHHLGVESEALPVLPGNDATRPGIVHRLDKDTSGVIVVAKTAAAQAMLSAQFQRHSIERTYLGIVVGVPEWAAQRIETLHGRDAHDRRRFSPHVERGRRAVTYAEVLARSVHTATLRFGLETGRTHQIRMHARAWGHPIFGDRLYGKSPKQPELRLPWESLPRHALHAALLGFDHPTGGHMRFESPLPPDLVVLGEVLGLR